MSDQDRAGKNAVCNTCTIRLVRIAYQRAPWFRLVREPLRLGMRGLAWLHRVDPAEYQVRTASCYGCMRFYKTALKEKSVLFRWLNGRVNPYFDALLARIVTAEEVREAKAYAREATAADHPFLGINENASRSSAFLAAPIPTNPPSP